MSVRTHSADYTRWRVLSFACWWGRKMQKPEMCVTTPKEDGLSNKDWSLALRWAQWCLDSFWRFDPHLLHSNQSQSLMARSLAREEAFSRCYFWPAYAPLFLQRSRWRCLCSFDQEDQGSVNKSQHDLVGSRVSVRPHLFLCSLNTQHRTTKSPRPVGF